MPPKRARANKKKRHAAAVMAATAAVQASKTEVEPMTQIKAPLQDDDDAKSIEYYKLEANKRYGAYVGPTTCAHIGPTTVNEMKSSLVYTPKVTRLESPPSQERVFRDFIKRLNDNHDYIIVRGLDPHNAESKFQVVSKQIYELECSRIRLKLLALHLVAKFKLPSNWQRAESSAQKWALHATLPRLEMDLVEYTNRMLLEDTQLSPYYHELNNSGDDFSKLKHVTDMKSLPDLSERAFNMLLRFIAELPAQIRRLQKFCTVSLQCTSADKPMAIIKTIRGVSNGLSVREDDYSWFQLNRITDKFFTPKQMTLVERTGCTSDIKDIEVVSTAEQTHDDKMKSHPWLVGSPVDSGRWLHTRTGRDEQLASIIAHLREKSEPFYRGQMLQDDSGCAVEGSFTKFQWYELVADARVLNSHQTVVLTT